jgi:fructose-bisphosphate aldolase class II
MKEVVKARMIAFGQAGHARDYEPIPLEEMARRYQSQTVAR